MTTSLTSTHLAPRQILRRVEKRVRDDGLTIKEACIEVGVSEKTYYKWKKHQCLGDNEPARQRPGRKSGIEFSEALQKQVAEFSMADPSLNYDQVRDRVCDSFNGFTISSSSVRKILKSRKLATRGDRLAALAELARKSQSQLSDRQWVFALGMLARESKPIKFAREPGQLLLAVLNERLEFGTSERGRTMELGFLIDLNSMRSFPFSIPVLHSEPKSSSKQALKATIVSNWNSKIDQSIIGKQLRRLEKGGHCVRKIPALGRVPKTGCFKPKSDLAKRKKRGNAIERVRFLDDW